MLELSHARDQGFIDYVTAGGLALDLIDGATQPQRNRSFRTVLSVQLIGSYRTPVFDKSSEVDDERGDWTAEKAHTQRMAAVA